MKKLIALIIFIASFTATHAQEHFVSIKTGQIDLADYKIHYHKYIHNGYSAGINVAMKLS